MFVRLKDVLTELKSLAQDDLTALEKNCQYLEEIYLRCYSDRKCDTYQQISVAFQKEIRQLAKLVYSKYALVDAHPIPAKDYMENIPEERTYYVHVLKKQNDGIIFRMVLLAFAMVSILDDRMFASIDLEFTKRKVKLLQMALEHKSRKESISFVFSPVDMPEEAMNTFFNTVLLNQRVTKLMHGADSQDIHVIYQQFLKDDKEKITKFTTSMIDTKLVCDYYTRDLPGSPEPNCAIYGETAEESAIFQVGLINQSNQDFLTNMQESMPFHESRVWNVNTIDTPSLEYAHADVIFLKWFYLQMMSNAVSSREKDMGKDTVALYYRVLPEIMQWCYLERHGIITVVAQSKEDSDPVNNYFLFNNPKVKLVDIYRKVQSDIIISSPHLEIDKIRKVNYFRKTVEGVLKRMVYGHLSNYQKKFRVNKKLFWSTNLDNQWILDSFQEVCLPCLAALFSEVNEVLYRKVKKEMSSLTHAG